MIWELLAFLGIALFMAGYFVGRRGGVGVERARCLGICLSICNDDNKLSPSLRRAQHAIAHGLQRPLSEDEFFGPEAA